MRRRRRKDWTPEQKDAREKLHRAETWSMIVGDGVAEALKRERYCGDGLRTIIDFVNVELLSAVTAMEKAQEVKDKLFERPGRVKATVTNVSRSGAITVLGRSGKNPAPKKKAAKK